MCVCVCVCVCMHACVCVLVCVCACLCMCACLCVLREGARCLLTSFSLGVKSYLKRKELVFHEE